MCCCIEAEGKAVLGKLLCSVLEEARLRWLILLTTFWHLRMEQGTEEQLNNACGMVGEHILRTLDEQ